MFPSWEDNDQFDKGFYNQIMSDYTDIVSTMSTEGDEELYNRDITLDEVEGAISRLKKGKAPGPDMYPTDLFIQGGDNLRSAIHTLFSMSWKEGALPEMWKSADVKFLRKPGKPNYYSPSSYRPISLTSCLAKIMERIITSRLEAHIEGNHIIDAEQDGFRRKHSTVHAVLRLVQAIHNGFERDQYTAAIFIDLKGAYDSIWREGLVYKLNSIGIQGRMLTWINDFLNNRTARCLLDNTKGQVFKTTVGLPQGSVLSPILFNIYVIDMYKEAGRDHCKYADDGTDWATEKTPEKAVEKACQKGKTILDWCRIWRVLVSLTKTEASLFSRNTLQTVPPFKLGDTILTYSKIPKILGITLDEQLTFEPHIQNVINKASRALKVIREVKGIGRVSTQKLIRLYTATVRPIMEYGASIWQGSKHVHRLATVQRKALCLCLGLPGTAGTEVAEVAAGLPPLDLYLKQITIRELAKIQAKSVSRPIKQMLNNLTETTESQEVLRQTMSPIRLALTYAKEMERETGIDYRLMEEEPEFEEGCVAMTASAPHYWSRLGSSKTRTSEQQRQGKELVLDMMMEAPEGTAFAFTDGSCLTNPGPCGAGAVIYLDQHQSVRLKRPVAKRGSILLGELVAILMTLEYALQNLDDLSHQIIKVFCVSQSAVGILTLNWKDTSYRDVTRDIKKASTLLEQSGVQVEINWAPGHSSIAGNEEADKLAKEAAHEASLFTDDRKTTSISDIKAASQAYTLSQWQRRWDTTEVGRNYYKYHPKVNTKVIYDQPTKEAYSMILQLQTGYTYLNDYRSKLNQTLTNRCRCGQVEDTEHYLLQCPLQDIHRDVMARNLGQKIGLYHLDLQHLLGSESDSNIPGYQETVKWELAEYIRATGRFTSPPKTPSSP